MRDNRSHRISQSRKKKIPLSKKGLIGTGIDQYSEGGRYEQQNKSFNSSEKQES